ncbi:MAG TPA: hypothetical protein VGG84_07900 [Gemmatimonadaceae bacterium]
MRLATPLRCVAALSLGVVLAAHVGSPDAFYSGKAGPYSIDVAVRPPTVVPGIAEVYVLVHDPAGVGHVVVRPVFWRAGTKGAPAGDDAKPVDGVRGAYLGQLWLMTSGAYAVNVTVSGDAGTGSVDVPIAAVATGQLPLGTGLKVLLGVLGMLLIAGLVAAVHSAVGESLVPPGEKIPPTRLRHADMATIIAMPVVGIIVFSGFRWWGAEAARYQRTLYRPVATSTAVRDSAGIPMLTMSITDSTWRAGRTSPVMPDHGKLAHLFLARTGSLDVFAHLHPSMPDRATLATPLPALPAGTYRVYADIVQETGFQRTLVDSITLPAPLRRTGEGRLGPDDTWFTAPATKVERSGAESSLGDGLAVRWLGSSPVTVGTVGVLLFGLHDAYGRPVHVEPFLGMLGHAVVMRRDGGVFVHLHPSGTQSTASQLAFALRDRGDTTSDGRLQLDSAAMNMAAPASLEEIRFPYAFPSPGEYRVWVQLRADGRVRTAAFDIDAVAAR